MAASMTFKMKKNEFSSRYQDIAKLVPGVSAESTEVNPNDL